MKRFLSLSVIVLFAFSAPALANIDEGDGEIGFEFGQTQFDDNGSNLDSGTRLGLRGGYLFNRNFELEGQYASSDETVSEPAGDADFTMRTMMVNGVYNFRPNRQTIVPYVMAGLGMADVEVQVPGDTFSDNTMAYQIGGGSRFFFGEHHRAAFRVDVSMMQADNFSESSTHTSMTAGFTFRLGAAR